MYRMDAVQVSNMFEVAFYFICRMLCVTHTSISHHLNSCFLHLLYVYFIINSHLSRIRIKQFIRSVLTQCCLLSTFSVQLEVAQKDIQAFKNHLHQI
jgi:hypothetical protein